LSSNTDLPPKPSPKPRFTSNTDLPPKPSSE
jgi:hypothetical protein